MHPEAAHPALLRLGAAEATPRTVLDDPLTKAAVSQSLDSPDPEPVAKAVLSLVEASGLAPGERRGWPSWRCAAATATSIRPAS
ncbi:hypothetical protein GCM10020001_037420 [Nonomuraea salmonea]